MCLAIMTYAGAWKASRFLGCAFVAALVAALYAMTLAGCAIDLAGHEPATRDAMVPEPFHQSDAREARTPPLKSHRKTKDVAATSSAKQHKKVADGWSLASITAIPLPDSDLLVPPSEPNCELEAPESKAGDTRKSDFEKQCYRAAEVFARSRLLLLQSSVEKMIAAITDTGRTIQETSGSR
jgi:hypothetical protein